MPTVRPHHCFQILEEPAAVTSQACTKMRIARVGRIVCSIHLAIDDHLECDARKQPDEADPSC